MAKVNLKSSADDKLMIFFLFVTDKCSGILCKLFPKEKICIKCQPRKLSTEKTVCMKCQPTFSEKDENISKCHLLKAKS